MPKSASCTSTTGLSFFSGIHVYATIRARATSLLNRSCQMVYANVALHVIVFLHPKLAWRWIFIATKPYTIVFQLPTLDFIKDIFAGAVFKKAYIYIYASPARPISFGVIEVFAKAGIFHTPIYVINISY